MNRVHWTNRLRPILITLNFVTATAMLTGLAFGTPPPVLVSVPLICLTAVSAVVVLFSPGRQSRTK